MIIILEGANATGKSSLTEEIVNRTGGTSVHRLKPATHPLVWYTSPLHGYRPIAEALVYDRSHISERVYGPLWRGGCTVSPIEWAAIEALFNRLGAIVCVLYASAPTLAERIEERGGTPDLPMLQKELLAFDRAVTWSTLPVYQADMERWDRGRLADYLIRKAQKHEFKAMKDIDS